jgi:hypothetical protein|uniref:Uncharacterized protein n=1 Tax=Eutreptiella gymnastica TaxID=73025 RepID=A0A7S4GK54_9EUGL|mmetsp:Transcript_73358/g.123533  ORF Transcript_73358/g.123533 Transcript_73358/m.123533 type:complete len:199 (+) Transcript_73358:26-622(+)
MAKQNRHSQSYKRSARRKREKWAPYESVRNAKLNQKLMAIAATGVDPFKEKEEGTNKKKTDLKDLAIDFDRVGVDMGKHWRRKFMKKIYARAGPPPGQRDQKYNDPDAPTPAPQPPATTVTMEVDNDHKPIVAAEPSLLPEGLELDANGVPKAINNLPSVGRRTTLKSLRAPKRLGSMSSKPKTAKTRTRAKRELPAL